MPRSSLQLSELRRLRAGAELLKIESLAYAFTIHIAHEFVAVEGVKEIHARNI